MADTRTAPGVDRRPLISYLRVQRDYERQMLGILRQSNARIDAELRRLAGRSGVGAAVRRDQLALAQAAIHREMGTLWRQVGDTVEAGRADAAAAALRSTTGLTALRGVLPAEDLDYMLRSAEATARAGARNVEARVGLSQIPLAESVYKNQELANGKIDEIVNSALARGASAAELARDVRQFVRPDVRGGVRYSALRLGRTELNNAFHAQQVQTGIKEPWTVGLRWNLSGSHPRPDECNEYETGDLKSGAWSPNNVPAKPHPNCLCFTTPETVDRDTFIAQFEAGAYDDYLDGEFPDLPSKAPNVQIAAAQAARPTVPVPGSEAFLSGRSEAELARQNLLASKFDGKGNYNVARGWTSRNKQALENYQYDGIRYNELARDPIAFAKEHGDSDVAFYGDDMPYLDDLISKNPLDRDVVVSRGVMHDVSDISVGDHIADPGYLSTSSDLQTAISFASESRYEGAKGFKSIDDYRAHTAAAKQDGWLFITQAPKGTPAIYGDETQFEIIFGRGTRQEVLDIDPDKKIIYTKVVP